MFHAFCFPPGFRILAALCFAAAAVTAALTAGPAAAHGIAGNRFFPGTMTLDDPAVADELVMGYERLKHPAADGAPVTDNGFNGAFARLLTPTWSVGFDTAWTWRHRSGFEAQNGSEGVMFSLKHLLYENDPHETLIAARLGWGVAHSGDWRADADQSHTFQPALFFGRGFGDLPDALSFLRPFALTGGVAVDFRTRHEAAVTDVSSGQLTRTTIGDPNFIHWGFSLQFSTLYLTPRFTGGPPKEEPLNQLLPLVEFAFDTPFGTASDGKTLATMSPGLAYVAETWHLAAEAILPLNRHAGSGVGARAQLLFFLDDLIPEVFGRPLLSR